MNRNRLCLYLFGQLRIEKGGKPIHLPTRKANALLAYLVLHPNPHSREKLATLFWEGASEIRARASLRNALAVLRKNLGDDLLLADRERIQINPAYSLWVDALTFKGQTTQYLSAPSPDVDVLQIELYTDDLLVDVYEDWAWIEREGYRSLYIDTLLECTQQMRSQSEYERAIEFGRTVLDKDPANERAHQHLMFCRMALGDRNAALRQYEACRRSLESELDVEPSLETKMLHRWIQHMPSAKTTFEASITNLPIPLTRFIGRQREMVKVKTLLTTARLLTLTGTGGTGKTRLAIQVAMDLLDAFRDGVWWIDLAARIDESLLARTVAKALGVSEVANQPLEDTLIIFIRPRKLLLVLDNCEHLRSACGLLAERLLSACPHLKILATSRQALGCTGEYVWYVPTLTVPDPESISGAEQLMQYESAHLFVERAVAVYPDFTLAEANTLPVALICQRLDGMPLALELAAARVKVLSVHEIASRLDDAFRLLTSDNPAGLARHQTLRAAIDWSYDLLSVAEQALLGRLAIFSGGWTLQAVEAICAGEGIEKREVLDLLSRLVDQSLVEKQEQNGQARFRMLQTIQQYSWERLRASGEFERIRDRHLAYFLQLAEAANPHLGYFLSDPEMEAWLARLEEENDNLRTALHWSLEKQNGVEAGLHLASILHWFWFVRGQFSEGRKWLVRLLALRGDVPTPTRAHALLTLGFLACWQGDFASGHAPLEQALTLFQGLEEERASAFALHGLGFAAMGEGNLDLSRTFFEEALTRAREAGDRWLTSFSMHFLAIVLTYQGDYIPATAYFDTGNTLLEQLGGHKQGQAFSLFHLARIARRQGDLRTAQRHLAQAIQLFYQTGDRRGVGYSLAGFAVLAVKQQDLQRAARLSGVVTSIQERIGGLLEAPLQIEYDQEIAAVRSALGEETFNAVWARGRVMTIEQAIDVAVMDR